MSKKSNVNPATESTNPMTLTIVELKELFESNPNVSLRKLALATDVTYGMLLKAAKSPIAGEMYDPEATNYGAINNVFIKKLIDLTKVNWTELNETASKATLVKDHSQFAVGMNVYLRKHATTPYQIIYKTETHIVILLDGTTEPQSWAITTFMFNGPSLEPRVEKTENVAE